jgi:hypothetical protein
MKRAADMTNKNDPLRAAVSRALFGTPSPADTTAAAKVRLRLYAGLNAWALDNLFKPGSGAIAGCQRDFGANKGECEALVAASGNIDVAEARKLGGGTAPQVAATGRRFGGGQPARFTANRGGQPSRFSANRGGQPSRFGGGQPSRFGRANQGSRFTTTRPAQARKPAPRAPQARKPAAAPARRAPAADAQTIAERKAAYKAQRQAYLERKKREMEARKAKLVAVAGGERAVRGPASEEEAEVAGLKKPNQQQAKPAAAKKAQEAAPAAAPEAEDAAQPEPPKKKDATLDEGFLGDLLDDPLGDK